MIVSRRRLLTGAGAVVATMLTKAALAQDFVPTARHPDPAVRALDPSFRKYMVFFGTVERIAAPGTAYAEGPVYFGDGRFLLWSDIPNNRILRWDEETGQTTIFRKPANYANGNTRDRQGRLVTAEHGRRVTVLADRFEGKRLNSPNDVVVASDDSIWFTDPPFGIAGNFSGDRAPSELPNNVYRLDRNGTLTVAASDVGGPNGLCFSPDETKLYIVDSFSRPVSVRVYDVADRGTRLANGRPFFVCADGEAPDGLRCDVDGNLWLAYGAVTPGVDGVLVLSPDAKRIGMIALPERAANLCFGGPKRNRLFVVTARGLYAVCVNTQGVKGT